MHTAEPFLSTLHALDARVMERCKKRWDSIVKPLGGLGRLEDAVIRIAGLSGDLEYNISKRAVAVFCADNGVVARGISQSGMDVTALVARNLTLGKTSVCAMARVAGADVIPVDVGMAQELEIPGLLNRRIAAGTHDIASGPAMSGEQARRAIQVGIDLAGELAGQGYKLLCTGEMGIGNTTTSSAVASVLLGREPARMTGRGAGLSNAALEHKIDVIRGAIALNKPDPSDPLDVLAKLGGFDIAAMAGICLGGYVHHIPVVLDGFISTVSALLACRIAPLAREALIASHLSAEPAGALVLEALSLEPLINAGMRLGEGSGAVAALPLLDMAYAVYNDMCTFDELDMEPYLPLK